LTKSIIPGFTGPGYLECKSGDARQMVEWIYNCPSEGTYTLEFRYSLKRQEDFISPLVINGKEEGQMTFWMNGAANSWVWDRITVFLQKGINHIQISPEGFVLLDHLNILN
jgi:hypothetical protein